MNSAISTILGGMQLTATKATEAANDVAHANLTISGTPPDQAAALSTPPTPAVINDTGKAKEPDALQAVLDFQEAARAHEAQLKAFQALSDMQQKLVEALGWAIPQSADTATSGQTSLGQLPSTH
jgi:flagellar basal body rod protein FlgC